MCFEVDTLFFEEKYHPKDFAPKTFDRFLNLCPELRNNIYEHILESEFKTIDINASGGLKKPAIMRVSKEIHAETIGYHNSFIAREIRNPNVWIRAQVGSYNFAPLMRTLEELAAAHDVAIKDLQDRVIVKYIGPLNIKRVLEYVGRHLDDPVAAPMWGELYCDRAEIPGLGRPHMFLQRRGLVNVVREYREACTRNRSRSWVSAANQFLENAAELGFGEGRVSGEVGVVAERAFALMVMWNHNIDEARKDRRKDRYMDLGHAFYSFWEDVQLLLQD